MPMATWTSKLGATYPLATIQKKDKQAHATLQKLRRRPENATCADCGSRGTVWAIVNHGTFVCLRCASVHRSLGTHVSKPKGCTGTYLWGDDELASMARGNAAANRALGGDAIEVPPDPSDAVLRAFLVDKYDRKKWAPRAPEPAPDLLSFDDDEPPPPPAATPDFFGSYGL
ncbi:hypothetical protein SO694_00057250 [Aureococcus anophagefferens]|uniref:Arf-GAP domain-containing protein n=1 Tax=Aureococcus anophagefferens TaxID=44056 RepID=A0ABR1FX72_AURAN|nr:hypothetical protein JL722_5609 [Aureococcus anophagefferens]